MLSIEKEQGYSSSKPIMMWLPPTALILLKPFLIFNFKVSTLFFLAFNIIALITSGYLLQLTFDTESSSKKIKFKTILASIIFLPAWDCINFGQVSIYLLLFLSLFIFFLKKENYTLAAITLIPLSLKPHLFIIFGLALLLWLYKNKEWKFFLTALTSLCFLITASYLQNSHSLLNWLEAISKGGVHGAVTTQEWMPATIGTWLRIFLGQDQTYLMWIPTSIGMLYITLLDLKKDLLKIICISLTCTPYGWYYDQSIFLTLQIYLIYNNKTTFVFLIQIFYLLFKLAPLLNIELAQHHFAIFLIFWALIVLTLKASSENYSSSEKSSIST